MNAELIIALVGFAFVAWLVRLIAKEANRARRESWRNIK